MDPLEQLQLYKGREQSLIKHAFLSQYVQLAAFKILQARSNTFNYVDAFAGPWNVRGEDFSDSSFDLALNMLESVRVALARNGLAGLKIRFCLCEKNPAAVQKLRDYATGKRSFEIHIFPGLFEENLEAIAKAIPNGFTFTFIDPKGWNVKNADVFSFLRNRDGDFLLNFMSDHINRHAEYSQVRESFGRFLASPDWEEAYARLPEDWSSERCILFLLKQNLKSHGVARYLPDFSILVPSKNRIKMRLVLGTNSPAGLEVFRDVQAKVEVKQIDVRSTLHTEKTRQNSLFDLEVLAQQQGEVGSKASLKRAEARISEIITVGDITSFGSLANSILEELPIRKTQLKDLLNRLKKEKKVYFQLSGKERKVQDTTLLKLSSGQE